MIDLTIDLENHQLVDGAPPDVLLGDLRRVAVHLLQDTVAFHHHKVGGVAVDLGHDAAIGGIVEVERVHGGLFSADQLAIDVVGQIEVAVLGGVAARVVVQRQAAVVGGGVAVHGVDAVGEELAVLLVLLAVAYTVKTIDLGVDRVGDHAAHKKTLIEADQAVDLVVGVGLVLACVVLFGFETEVVVDVVKRTNIEG